MPAKPLLTLRNEDVIWRELGDEAVVLDQRSWRYLGLNETGKLLWQELEKGAARDTLASVLVDRYGLTSERAGADVATFLADLQERDLLR